MLALSRLHRPSKALPRVAVELMKQFLKKPRPRRKVDTIGECYCAHRTRHCGGTHAGRQIGLQKREAQKDASTKRNSNTLTLNTGGRPWRSSWRDGGGSPLRCRPRNTGAPNGAMPETVPLPDGGCSPHRHTPPSPTRGAATSGSGSNLRDERHK